MYTNTPIQTPIHRKIFSPIYTRTHTHTHVRIYNTYTLTFAYTHTHTHTYKYICDLLMYIYMCIYICMYVYICICYPDLVLWLPFADFSPPWLDFVVPASGSNLARLEWHVSRTRLTDSTFPGPRGHKLGRSDYFSDSMYYWYTKWHEYWVKKNSDMDYLVIYLQIYLVITKWLLGKLEYVTNLK